MKCRPKCWWLAATVLLCAVSLQAQTRIPLRVGVYMSDAVLAYKPDKYHYEVGRHVAETATAEFDKTFASVTSLRQYPTDTQALEGLDCIVVVEVPKAKASFTLTLTVSVPFTVFSPSGAQIFATTEELTRKVGGWGTPGAVKRTWFEMADAEVASFLDKFSQTELARKVVRLATTATLRITSQPTNAQVYVDETLAGATNASSGALALDGLSPGSHVLRLVAQDYADWTQTVTLTAGHSAEISATLTPRFSQLILQSQPGGAQVYLDDAFKGATSEQEGRLRIENLAPGSHQLRLSLQGYKEWIQQVTPNPAETLSVTAKLEPAGPRPLGLDEVLEALGNLPKVRVIAFVKQFGVDFALTPEAEQRLREKGADADLLLVIATNKK